MYQLPYSDPWVQFQQSVFPMRKGERMRGYFAKVIFLIFCISFFHLFPIHDARSEDSGLTIAGFQWGGSIELGYRLTDIDGRNRYKEVVNLMEGLRLFDFSLWGKNPDEKKGVVDYFGLNASGIGDPFPSSRLEIKKNKTYDFVATYKEFKYFFNREDNFFLTDNHDFNQRSRRGTLTLALFPKEDIQLNIGYSHSQRDGDAGVPRQIFPFALDQELKEQLNEYFISADLPIGNWDLHIKQSFWNFENKNKMNGPQFEKRDENVNTYVSTIKARTQFGDRWDLDTGYIYAHSEGRANLTAVPEIGVDSGRGRFNFNTHIMELGLSYLLRKDLLLHADYRFHTLNQDGHSNTDPFLSAPANASTDFNLLAHTGTFQLEYLPKENLTLRAGYRVQYRDINGDNFAANQFDGGQHSNDAKIWAHGWIASANWKPYKFLTLFGEYQGANFDNPYTRISPESENIAKIKVKYDTPIENLSLKGAVLWKRKVNPDQEFRVDVKDYIFTATYQPVFIPKLSLDASLTYEKILDKKDIFNIIPFSFETFFFDSSALIYSGGMSYEGIYKGLGARVNGSYAKTAGENSQRYADGVLSLWYKNKWVTPILTLERTYLIDRLQCRDNFDANLLTFSLRKEF
jgi:hypothetical protein